MKQMKTKMILLLCCFTAFSARIASAADPTTSAPAPTQMAGDVISLFSDAYTNVPVDTWSAVWDAADVSDYLIGGTDNVKKYTNLSYCGIEFTTQTIDATNMNYFHVDLWTPDASMFVIKLVDFGADGMFGGGDDTEQDLPFNTTTNPAVVVDSWVSFDIPLSDFTNLLNKDHLAQLLFISNNNTCFVDNIYFYYSAVVVPTEPTVSAPTPTAPAQDVISLFSNAYTNVPVDTWSAVWDAADVSDFVIGGNDDVKKYENLSFCGIEMVTTPVDATDMTYFHVDIWSPSISLFNIKLVDFGADGMYGGGDDTEQQLDFNVNTNPAVVSNEWVSFDLPLSSFGGLTTQGHIAQLIFVAGGSTVFVDNVYFYIGAVAPPVEPTVSAPVPTQQAADVISLFSDAYTNVPVDTWSTVWDNANVSDFLIGASDNVKKYTNLVFSGTEFTAPTVDATQMEYFHVDIWTPDATMFNIKLVDFGADGMFAGGDDSEQELAFTTTTNPAVVNSEWVSFDIPLSDFTSLTARGHLAQLIFVAGGKTVFVDNVYFHRAVASPHQSTDYQVVPNPAIDWMTVHFTNGIGLRQLNQVTIRDLNGHLWYFAPVVNGNINVASLPTGIYRLGFNADNRQYQVPFVKQ